MLTTHLCCAHSSMSRSPPLYLLNVAHAIIEMCFAHHSHGVCLSVGIFACTSPISIVTDPIFALDIIGYTDGGCCEPPPRSIIFVYALPVCSIA